VERGKRVQGGAATLAQLTRDYQVNRDIYQDLLRRREQARVSMNLDRDKQGLTFRIYEPATLPLQPSGLRYIHFIVIGLLASLMVPAAWVFAQIQLDPRVRFGAVLAYKTKIAYLATVPHLWSPGEAAVAQNECRRYGTAIGVTLLVIVVVSVVRVATAN